VKLDPRLVKTLKGMPPTVVAIAWLLAAIIFELVSRPFEGTGERLRRAGDWAERHAEPFEEKADRILS
jgi:hypothetical protein